jgi:hypothetical protein
MNESWGVRRFRVALKRLFIFSLLLVSLAGFMSACDGDSIANDGTDTGAQAAPCDGIFEGDYTIENQSDVDALAGYCEIHGDLRILGTELTSFALPALTSVSDHLHVRDNAALTSFHLVCTYLTTRRRVGA